MKQSKDNWKKRFDKEFTRSDGLIDKYSWYGVEGETAPQPTPKAIKLFIQKELAKTREEERKKIYKKVDDLPYRTDEENDLINDLKKILE